MKKVLFDTDLLLDFFLDRESFSHNAARILSLCEKKELLGFATLLIISDILSFESKS
jgi:predicted nucleic acid-binding protein